LNDMSIVLIPLVAAALFLLSDSPPPPPVDQVVLLPNADGSTGKLIVRSRSGEQVLATPYAAAQSNDRGELQTNTSDAATVSSRYAQALGAQPLRPVSFTLYFVSGSADQLTPTSTATLDQIKASLSQRVVPEILVIGHTDRVGKLEANDSLSVKRAETVKKLLQTAGIAAESMEVSGRGEREPLVPTADEVAEERNRRVEINIR
jgi:outer membrane protein OmpA-like peptidoglycan-associated protein